MSTFMLYSPNGEFYEIKNLDKLIADFGADELKSVIAYEENVLLTNDALEQLVKEGKLERKGGSEETEYFENVRETVKVLKKRLKRVEQKPTKQEEK